MSSHGEKKHIRSCPGQLHLFLVTSFWHSAPGQSFVSDWRSWILDGQNTLATPTIWCAHSSDLVYNRH